MRDVHLSGCAVEERLQGTEVAERLIPAAAQFYCASLLSAGPGSDLSEEPASGSSRSRWIS